MEKKCIYESWTSFLLKCLKNSAWLPELLPQNQCECTKLTVYVFKVGKKALTAKMKETIIATIKNKTRHTRKGNGACAETAPRSPSAFC